MKFFTLRTLLTAVVVSAVVSLPFVPFSKSSPEEFFLEARIASTTPGHAQLYYDNGGGFSETGSSRVTLIPGATPRLYRFALPPGSYRSLRLDPNERDGTVSIESLRVLDRKGRVVHGISPRQFAAGNQIASLVATADRLDVVIAPGSEDPQLVATFAPPIEIKYLRGAAIITSILTVFSVFVVLAGMLFTLERLPSLRFRFVLLAQGMAARPQGAVMIIAVAAVIASAYPVIFLGKSFVSPNFGTTLLYDEFPTLPGSKTATTTDIKGSDIGAIMWQQVPYSMIQHRALLRDGELPLWNRYNSGGMPLLGQAQSMFGDPLHFIVVLADGAAWAWDIKYLLAKWLFAVGLGLTVLALVRHLPAALMVSLAAPFLGFFVYRVNHPAFFSLCYAPWALYCWVRIAQAADPRSAARWIAGLMLANFALLNSGTVKEACMLLLGLSFSGCCVLLSGAESWQMRLGKLAGLVWAGLLFLLISAPMWLTFLDTLKHAYTSYDVATAFQIQPGMLLGAFDEAFYRPLSEFERVFNPSINFLLLGGLLYFIATLRLQFGHRAAMALALSALFPLAMAFGFFPPQWVIRIPFLSNVAHLDNSFTCVLIVLWSVLAGVGFATAAKRLGTREGRDDLIIAALLLFALVFAFVGFGQAIHRAVRGPGTTFAPIRTGNEISVSPFVWGYLMALIAGLFTLGYVSRRALAQRILTPAAALLLALCALVLLWRQGQQAQAVGFESYVVRPTKRADFHAKSDAVAFVQAAQAAEPGRAFGLNGNFFPGWTGTYDLEGVNGPDALMNPFYRELTGRPNIGVERIWDWRLYVSSGDVSAAHTFFDFLNVRYYFDLRSDQKKLGAVLKLDKVADLDVYESPSAWPRAFFTDRLLAYDQPAQLVQKIMTGDGRPFAAVQNKDLDTEDALARLPHELEGRSIAPARNYRLTANTTSFDVTATGPGVVLLTEVFWARDFRAELNGADVPVVRLNHAFKGVVIPAAGNFHVTFRYWPRRFSLALGMAVGGLALFGLSVFAIGKTARQFPSAQTP